MGTGVVASFRAVSLLLFWASAGSAALAVDAETAAAAREIAYEAKAAYDAGHYDIAQERAAAAYRLVRAPTLALLEARSLRQLNRWVHARELYRAAAKPLEASAPPPFKQARKEALHELGVLEEQLPRLLLVVESSDDIQVKLDGETVSPSMLGVATAQDPGLHQLSYRVQGRVEQRSFELFPGAVERIVIEAPPPASDTTEAAASEPNAWQPYAGWGAVGLGAAGMTTGVVQALRALSIKSDLDRNCTGAECPPEASSDINSYERARDISTAGYIVGAVSLAAGGFLLWNVSTDNKTISAHAGYGQAWVRGQF